MLYAFSIFGILLEYKNIYFFNILVKYLKRSDTDRRKKCTETTEESKLSHGVCQTKFVKNNSFILFSIFFYDLTAQFYSSKQIQYNKKHSNISPLFLLPVGSNGSDEDGTLPPPKPARPQLSTMSATGSIPNLLLASGGASSSPVPHQWSSTTHLAANRSQEQHHPHIPTTSGTHIEYQLQNYFPSSGYMQVR